VQPAAVWGDAAVIVPWVVHERFADLELLRAQYASMTAWVDQVAALAGEGRLWNFAAIAAEVADAFADEYVTPNGRLASDTQTAYAVALQTELLAKVDQRERAGRRLVELVESAGHHVATGFVGTPLICDALSAAGADDTAYRLLLQRDCPSWLYPVTMGATTMWERWDSMLPDGTRPRIPANPRASPVRAADSPTPPPPTTARTDASKSPGSAPTTSSD
jgi:alpha-L-rhamnosidase